MRIYGICLNLVTKIAPIEIVVSIGAIWREQAYIVEEPNKNEFSPLSE